MLCVRVLRVIYFILDLVQRYGQFLLDHLEMQAYFFLILYAVLVFQDFKHAESIYHFCFETLFRRNEEMIQNARKKIMNIWLENGSTWWTYIKKNIIALCHMLSRFLPATIQAFTEPFF